MLREERHAYIRTMLGGEEEIADEVLDIYLRQAQQKILNHRFPYGTKLVEVEPQYELDMLELAVYLYNLRGAEGQTRHVENGVTREWRTENEILSSIPRMAGIPK